MQNLIGTYECKADAKGRLMVPSPLRKQLLQVLPEGFVLRRSVFQKCLELYPMPEWNKLMEKISKLNRFSKKHDDFIRRFMAGVRMVELDAVGRLLIPKDLQEFANISKEVVLTSSISIIEIWDKAGYESVINETVDDFSDLAEEVMGNVLGDE